MAAFFVPLALAGGRVFFKFATKKAAQAFKGRFAKAGSVTTKAPAKNAQVTTTGSSKGKAIIKDLTKPVTPPRVSPRNPNTTKLPKAPAKSSGGAKLAGAAAAATGATSASTSTSKSADKNNRSDSKGGRSRDDVIAERQRRLAAKSAAQGGGSVLSSKKKNASSKAASEESAQRGAVRSAAKTSTAKEARKGPPQRKATTVTKKVTPPKAKPKMYTTIDPKTGKLVDKKVTAAQHLANLDKFKARKKALDLVKSSAKASMKKKGKK